MVDTPHSDADQGAESMLMPGLDLPDAASEGYQVLARKYRPSRFEDLIGQEAMVRTLTNAFAAGRIAHAYMLTGVRGVGKTTTARLIARALNYRTQQADAPSMSLSEPGEHCDAISRSAHVDVMEMDAASRTGVNDIREILDGVRYAPVSARYKVYIIDEVHMLSTSAFNALLKTLEEPPAHAKFIFATTEIRKVPVTVLSRCQRFDLKRIDREVLTDHLANICEKEQARVDRDGLGLIARAAEGSVRDALSLLDQAIVQGAESETPVDVRQVRDMLGLADRARVLDLLEKTVRGETADALAELEDLYDAGGDPVVITRDLLDFVHAASRMKAIGPDADIGESRETAERVFTLAQSQTLAQLTRLWKLLLGGLDDVRAAPDALAAAEMTLLRLAAASMLPPPEDAARLLASHPPATASAPGNASAPAGVNDAAPGGSMEAPGKPEAQRFEARPAPQDLPVELDPPGAGIQDGPDSFETFITMLSARRDISLQSDVERYCRPVMFKPGQMTFQPEKNAPMDLAPRIARKLQEWTGAAWVVLADRAAKGGQTWSEKRAADRQARLDRAKQDPAVLEAMRLFPGTELVKVVEGEARAAPGAAAKENDA
ncbi:DNA polymerase III subunit gamma/tau [Maricaulis sp. D1M11]|uniref:DNA polymerase III subunit gamma/tau n=1 Tax=Maricaulis sp. D1M11 TaxID=3076117 RepID=UPI0039B42BBA